ncbi:hypothetical protein ABZ901_03815 [Actinacidiphila alni]|uniref:hypothetical protein n=1 Tax=Actinacidiphila alni TaxID=380248 RepID=UPI0033DB940B
MPRSSCRAAVEGTPFRPRSRPGRPDHIVSPLCLNAAPAARVESDGCLAAVSLSVEHGRVTRIQIIANPHKPTRLDAPSDLAR